MKEDDSGDGALIARTLDGDQEAFRTLINKYKDPIYDLCLRMLGNVQDAEDVTQDAFVLLYRHLSQYRPGHKVSNWVYTIALNRCRRQLRKRKLLRFLSLDFFSQDPEEARAPEPRSQDREPDSGLEQQESERFTQRVLNALPDNLKGPFVLRYVKRMSYHQIAETTHLSLANVKVRLHRAKLFIWKRFGRKIGEGT